MSVDASTSEIKQSQAMQQSAADKIVASVQQEVVQLRSSNESLRHHIDTKADKVYLQQVRSLWTVTCLSEMSTPDCM